MAELLAVEGDNEVGGDGEAAVVVRERARACRFVREWHNGGIGGGGCGGLESALMPSVKLAPKAFSLIRRAQLGKEADSMELVRAALKILVSKAKSETRFVRRYSAVASNRLRSSTKDGRVVRRAW